MKKILVITALILLGCTPDDTKDKQKNLTTRNIIINTSKSNIENISFDIKSKKETEKTNNNIDYYDCGYVLHISDYDGQQEPIKDICIHDEIIISGKGEINLHLKHENEKLISDKYYLYGKSTIGINDISSTIYLDTKWSKVTIIDNKYIKNIKLLILDAYTNDYTEEKIIEKKDDVFSLYINTEKPSTHNQSNHTWRHAEIEVKTDYSYTNQTLKTSIPIGEEKKQHYIFDVNLNDITKSNINMEIKEIDYEIVKGTLLPSREIISLHKIRKSKLGKYTAYSPHKTISYDSSWYLELALYRSLRFLDLNTPKITTQQNIYAFIVFESDDYRVTMDYRNKTNPNSPIVCVYEFDKNTNLFGNGVYCSEKYEYDEFLGVYGTKEFNFKSLRIHASLIDKKLKINKNKELIVDFIH